MKTAVLTGSTSGIGELILKGFLKKGYRVFAGYRNETHKNKLQELSVNVVPFYIDMTKRETISKAAEFILEHTDKIDTLVNAAGCVIAGAMEHLDTDKIRTQFEVNTLSHLEFTQKLFPKLKNAKIINISSTASFGIYPLIAPYCASKRALDMLFNCLALENKDNIKVISIKPGVIKTPLWEKSIELNQESLDSNNEKYEKEFNFLAENARINQNKGLDARVVADLVIKIDSMKSPKPSYVVGLDAKIAEVISHLPASWINFLVKKALKKRCKM
jgi:NAD(P)-dependent dehydrogenase (short-subunit alcohol dehydrogenase family)